MHKILFPCLLFATASVAAFAQVGWLTTPDENLTITGEFSRTDDIGHTNLFLSPSTVIYDGTSYHAGGFVGVDGHLQFQIQIIDAADPDFALFGPNFRVSLSNSDTNPISAEAGTYQFHFDTPITTSGYVTGFNVINDPGEIANIFAFSFDGLGGIDVTQTLALNLTQSYVGNFTGNLTATAVPEPATTAIGLALAAGAVVAWRRRQRS